MTSTTDLTTPDQPPAPPRTVATYYRTALMRYGDLAGRPVVKLDGKWRQVYEVWNNDSPDPADTFGPGGETTRQIRDAIDWTVPTWVVLRYFVPEASTATQFKARLTRRYIYDLVEVQVPLVGQ
jgi:hypothetical protein